jgi:hypothetical protein
MVTQPGAAEEEEDDVLLTMASAVVLVLLTILIHYEVLRVTSEHLSELSVPPRFRIVPLVLAAFAAHTVEIWLYGIAYYLLSGHVGELRSLGDPMEFADFIYFSASTYSTIGYGDIAPHGGLRLIAAIEGLNGLVLVAWSASFTYVAMEKYWPLHAERRRHRRKAA